MIQITKGKIPTAKKVVIYGPEGIGKSTLAACFPDAVFIDTEGSTKNLDVARYPAPTCWDDIMAEIADAGANNTCKTLVIDTADWAEQLCIREVCTKNGVKGIEDFGYGKGYTYLMEYFSKLLRECQLLVDNGINVVFTAHAQMRKFEQPDEMGAYDRWEMKLSKKCAPLLKEWADMVLFCNYRTMVITDNKTQSKKATGGQRIMYTTHHPCWDAKNRYGLPETMEMDFMGISHLFDTPAPADTLTVVDMSKKAKGKKAPKFKSEFERTMFTNGLTMEDIKAFSEAKGNFPGTAPEDYPDNYKEALMKIESIEKIKKFKEDMTNE